MYKNWREKIKLSADDIIEYTDNTKESINKLLKIICEYSKITTYKVNI